MSHIHEVDAPPRRFLDRILRRTAIPEEAPAPFEPTLHYPVDWMFQDGKSELKSKDIIEDILKLGALAFQSGGEDDMHVELSDIEPFQLSEGRWSTIFKIDLSLSQFLLGKKGVSEADVNNWFLKAVNLYATKKLAIDHTGINEQWNIHKFPDITSTTTPTGTVFSTPNQQ